MGLQEMSVPKMVSGMKRDAIRVDWRRATKILEDLVNVECLEAKSEKKYTFEERLKVVDLLYRVNRLHRLDDITGYLNLLEDNRSLMTTPPENEIIIV